MSSAIDVTVPVFGNPTTESQRLNWGITSREITELQDLKANRVDVLPLLGGTMRGPLLLAANPTAPLGAATRQYVDAAPFLPLDGGTMRGPLLLAGPPTTGLGATTRNYVDTAIGTSENVARASFLAVAGGTMNGPLLLANDPVENRGAATKYYVDFTVGSVAGITEAPRDGFSYGRGDSSWARVLRLDGGTMTGSLGIGQSLPDDATPHGLRLRGGVLALDTIRDGGANVAFNAYPATDGWHHLSDGPVGAFGFDGSGPHFVWSSAPAGAAGAAPAWFQPMRLDATGDLTVGGALFATGGLFANNTTDFGIWADATNRMLHWAPEWFDGWRGSDGLRSWNAHGRGAIMTLDGLGGLWTGSSVQSPNLNALSAAGTWDGSVVRVGANMTHHWQIIVDGNATLLIRRSDILAPLTLDAAGSLGVAGHISTGGAVTGGAVNSNGDMWCAGTVTAAAVSAGSHIHSSNTAHIAGNLNAGSISTGSISTGPISASSISTGSIGGVWDFGVGGTISGQQGTFSNATVHGTINTNQVTCSGFSLNGSGTVAGDLWVNAQINSGNYAPGTAHGAWNAHAFVVVSDLRTKKNVQDYRVGLSEVLRLHPITYQHNGLGRTLDDGHVYSGLAAQDVEPVIPEMVVAQRSKLRAGDAEDAELLGLDAMTAICALINTAHELHARIDALEGRAR